MPRGDGADSATIIHVRVLFLVSCLLSSCHTTSYSHSTTRKKLQQKHNTSHFETPHSLYHKTRSAHIQSLTALPPSHNPLSPAAAAADPARISSAPSLPDTEYLSYTTELRTTATNNFYTFPYTSCLARSRPATSRTPFFESWLSPARITTTTTKATVVDMVTLLPSSNGADILLHSQS